MFNSLSGTITGKQPRLVYLETQGIEWEIAVSDTTLNQLPRLGESARVYTWLYHREDTMALFGFASVRERSLFWDLLKVEGIGAKGALKIMSSIAAEQLENALENEDLTRLETVPGIGKKTAQRMMLALKGKLSFGSSPWAPQTGTGNPAAQPWQDVIVALSNMGYDKRDAEAAVIRLTADLAQDAHWGGLAKSAQEEILLRRGIVELARPGFRAYP
ncbi:MAG: Holliday junction branch migration protein RuvA [Spirochaetaceae bacterium]|jgi:Holliday junction DNA helicase RuvA|nr:Holliday junction branch migration protein RuvA [Spirochaetaceae bacterium]